MNWRIGGRWESERRRWVVVVVIGSARIPSFQDGCYDVDIRMSLESNANAVELLLGNRIVNEYAPGHTIATSECLRLARLDWPEERHLALALARPSPLPIVSTELRPFILGFWVLAVL